DGTGYNKANSEIGTAAALTANNDKTGYALGTTASNDLSDVIWNEPVAAHGTTNQFGGLIVDNLDAKISGISATIASTAIDDIADAVWEEPIAGHATTDDFGGFTQNRMDDQITSRASTDKTGYALASTARDDVADDVWDETVVGHASTDAFGGMIVDNLDANITSRMSSTRSTLGSTEVANANLTQVKGSSVNADNWVTNIDDTISSRASTAEVDTALATLNDISTGNIDTALGTLNDISTGNVDTAVSSLATTGNIDTALGTLNDISTGNVDTSINTALFLDATSESTGLGGSLGNKISATYERMYNHHQQDSSTQVVMKSGSTLDVKFVMTVTNTSTLQTVQEATTA
ncbi:hypothetical protein LCGC14_2544670, partial [marine sediment metagenome]